MCDCVSLLFLMFQWVGKTLSVGYDGGLGKGCSWDGRVCEFRYDMICIPGRDPVYVGVPVWFVIFGHMSLND